MSKLQRTAERARDVVAASQVLCLFSNKQGNCLGQDIGTYVIPMCVDLMLARFIHQFTNECTIQDMCILGRPVARPKSPEEAKSFASPQGRTLGSNDGELLYSKYIGCKAKHQRVQRDVGAIDGVIAHNAPAW